MLRRSASACLMVCLVALNLSFAVRLPAQTVGVNVVELKETLAAGLKARRPEDFAFLNLVCTKVANKQLPYELVLSTFHWARRNSKYEDYPFPYFERALRQRAKKLGIDL